jgi:hypothetical protein
MDAEALVKLLGLISTDPRVEDALRAYGVMRRPELGIDPDDADGPVVKSQDWVTNLSAGIEFGFQEEGAYMGLDQTDRGVGPMLLTEIYFYGERPGTRPYPHLLPFRLSLSDSRDAARARLAPMESLRRSYVRDTWDHPNFRMTVSYADDGASIDFVVCMLRTEAPEPFEGGTAPMPSVATLVGLLGKRMNDPALRQVFVPLGLDRHALTTTEQVVDFRRTHGFKLTFCKGFGTIGGTPSTMLLHEIECLRAGEFESRGWHGELPMGIGFDDSPETVIAKVGRAPDHQSDRDFAGQAYWEQEEYGLLVVYSTMENIVLRVCLTRPGA